MGEQRLGRIADQIQRELAELIRLEVRDPRVGMATLTGVEVSRDQSHAKVFFTLIGTPEEIGACAEGLNRAAGFLRSSLARRMTTRKVPALAFAYDESVERGMRLSRLIDEAIAPPPPPPPPKPTARKRRSGKTR